MVTSQYQYVTLVVIYLIPKLSVYDGLYALSVQNQFSIKNYAIPGIMLFHTCTCSHFSDPCIQLYNTACFHLLKPNGFVDLLYFFGGILNLNRLQ